jgi:hypothetical protein
LLQRYGVRDRNTIRRFAAALQDIERAERRRAALGYSSGLIPKILADGGVVWTGCGKRVDNRPSTPPLDDEDAWRDKYIGGPLAPYIIGGERNDLPVADVDDAPPDEVDEASEPERYRRDAAHAVVHGWVPPALRPMPVPPDVPPDDDPEVRTYQHYGGLPQWDEGETP